MNTPTLGRPLTSSGGRPPLYTQQPSLTSPTPIRPKIPEFELDFSAPPSNVPPSSRPTVDISQVYSPTPLSSSELQSPLTVSGEFIPSSTFSSLVSGAKRPPLTKTPTPKSLSDSSSSLSSTSSAYASSSPSPTTVGMDQNAVQRPDSARSGGKSADLSLSLASALGKEGSQSTPPHKASLVLRGATPVPKVLIFLYLFIHLKIRIYFFFFFQNNQAYEISLGQQDCSATGSVVWDLTLENNSPKSVECIFYFFKADLVIHSLRNF